MVKGKGVLDMLSEMPYFMTNEEWYYHDKKEWKFKLTDKAPPEAIESYKKFYAQYEPYKNKKGEWIERS